MAQGGTDWLDVFLLGGLAVLLGGFGFVSAVAAWQRWSENHRIRKHLRACHWLNPISREERMRTRRLLQILTAGFAVILFQSAPQLAAQNQAPAALTGQVTSEKEGATEGVGFAQ